MNGQNESYHSGGGALQNAVGIIRNSSITERLEAEKTVLEDRLREVNGALDALRAKPEIADLINLVARVAGGRY